jgi:hypothetical protein
VAGIARVMGRVHPLYMRLSGHPLVNLTVLFEGLGRTWINVPSPSCQQLFKVRLLKLQFDADRVSRVCEQAHT